MKPTPILLLSDSPAIRSGLAKITRHLADLLSKMPEFRVGTLGRGLATSCHLPWPQYTYPEDSNWGQEHVRAAIEDLQAEVVLTIMDASRIHWLTRPQYLPGGDLRTYLLQRRFKLWSYVPVDHMGPNGGLSSFCADAIQGVDRPLAYSMFGAEVLRNTLQREVEWIPHGCNLDTFQPRDRTATRAGFQLNDTHTVIGTVMTNQSRKDWGCAAATIAQLKKTIPNLQWWICIDEMVRYWDLHALIVDYGLEKIALPLFGMNSTDTMMSYYYSMCDLTILPTLGEGFGYPVVESLACGVPCITTNYAGSVELVPRKEWLVEPAAWRIDSQYNCVRPVTRPEDWVTAIQTALASPASAEECRESVRFLDWPNLAPVWQKWLLEGLK